MSETFDADWLALRESFDAAARSTALVPPLRACLPSHPRILDLGAGTGSLFRWLAPQLGKAQDWTLIDADAGLLARAMDDIAAWADRQGWEITRSAVLVVHAPTGPWRVEVRQMDLAAGVRPLLEAADLVTCSALVDLVSREWIDRLALWVRGPVLSCLGVDGRDAFMPPDAEDAAVLDAFRRDQTRDKGFGPALGTLGAAYLHDALTKRGLRVTTRGSDWHVPAEATAMLTALVDSHAAVAARPDWGARRRAQIAQGQLAISIGHRDSLAVPKR